MNLDHPCKRRQQYYLAATVFIGGDSTPLHFILFFHFTFLQRKFNNYHEPFQLKKAYLALHWGSRALAHSWPRVQASPICF